MHAAPNLSRCLSGCSVYALCAALLSSALPYALYCTALLIYPLLSSHLHLSSFSFSLLSLSLPAFLSHYTLLSLLCIAVLCSAVWENTVHSGAFFRARADYTPATGGRGFRCSWCSRFGLPWTLWICVGRRGGEGREEGEGGQRAAQVRASSAWGGKGSKVVAVVVAVVVDGCPSRVMPWDLRAFRQLELETLSHFGPPSGAALILVPGKAAGHQWLHREEWAP